MKKIAKDLVDVLVIGAGPTGSTLAIDLARRGLNVRIVDKAAGAFDGSRAKGIQPRTLEVLEDLGALVNVLAGGSNYPRLGIHLGPLAIPWRMFKQKAASSDVPFPNTWLIPQYRTDRALHARLEELGIRVEFDKELVELTQDSEQVSATLKGPDGTEQVCASYLVGADGGASRVRTALGIGFTGSTDEQDRMVIADVVVTGLSRDRWHVWPRLGGRFVGACPIPHSDLFQWMIRLAPGEEPMRDREGLSRRIAAHTRNSKIKLGEVHWTSVFRPNIRLADRYQEGRVFITGDAAHVHTPAGAQGLNTGIQDAYNLGWKIAQVLAGADPQLLASYEAERRPIASAVLGLSTGKYEGLSTLSPSSIRRGKDEQQLAITYSGGPLAPSTAERTQSLGVGDRAPDAVLISKSGDKRRLFAEFAGPHFTLIGYGERAASELNHVQWPLNGAALKRIALTDSAGTFAQNYGVSGDAMILIRPDGYIGHIALHEFVASIQNAARAMVPADKENP